MYPATVTCFMCPDCKELHFEYKDAVECCYESPPEVTLYECVECYAAHVIFADAEACCSAERDDLLEIPEYLRRVPGHELEFFGQLRLL